jgi:hypothetical protein
MIYKEFSLRTPSTWPAFIAFVKNNAEACNKRGEPLRLIVTSDEKKRSNEQNRFFHGPVLDAITNQAWWGGKQYPKEFWKEYFRRRYLFKETFLTPDGDSIPIYWSTADKSFSVGMMSDFLIKVQCEASTEWGVCFE